MAKQQGPKGRGKSCSRELLKFSTDVQRFKNAMSRAIHYMVGLHISVPKRSIGQKAD